MQLVLLGFTCLLSYSLNREVGVSAVKITRKTNVGFLSKLNSDQSKHLNFYFGDNQKVSSIKTLVEVARLKSFTLLNKLK
jgi:hypothetical protein